MNRALLLSLISIVFLLPSAAAQNYGYLGVRLAAATGLEEVGSDLAPYLGFQLGIQMLSPLELRVVYDLSLGLTNAQADLLYSQSLGDEIRGYGGVGVDYYKDGWNGARNYSIHVTVGVEQRTGIAGFFAELQPIYGFSIAALRFRFSVGVNLHF